MTSLPSFLCKAFLLSSFVFSGKCSWKQIILVRLAIGKPKPRFIFHLTNNINHTAAVSFSCLSVRVLERIGARALVAHVRTFADFLVYEFSTSAGGQQLNKCIEILNDMVWKYNIVTLDRLILCLVSFYLAVLS
jgi:hypothetical protein